MEDLARNIEFFFFEDWSEVAMEFSDIVEEMQDPTLDWTEYPRIPTALEIMAACCSLEKRGVIETRFIGGKLNFVASVPCSLASK
jgi:hypothetical protein